MKKRQPSLESKKHYHVEIVDLDVRSYKVGDALSFKFVAEDEAESKAKEMFGEGNIQKKSPGTLEDTRAIAVYVSASSPWGQEKSDHIKNPRRALFWLSNTTTGPPAGRNPPRVTRTEKT